MNRRTLIRFAGPVLLLVTILASAAPALADSNPFPSVPSQLPNPDGIFTALQTQAMQIEGSIQTFANSLFLALAALDVIWTVTQAMLGGRSDVLELMVAVTQKFITLNIVYWGFVVNGFSIVTDIINKFDGLGKSTEALIGAGAPTDPLTIFVQGIGFAAPAIALILFLGAIPDLLLGTGSTNLWSGIINLETINAALIVGSYTFLAGTLALALFEAYVVTASGIFVTGFFGSRWTSSLGEKYFSYALSVGVKLLMTYICIGLLQPLGPFVAGTSAVPLFGGFVALAAAVVAYSAPNFAASILSGSSNSNFGQFSGMLTNLASSGFKAVSGAIEGYAEAGKEAATAAISLGAVGATGGAAAPLLGAELGPVAETSLGSQGGGNILSSLGSGGGQPSGSRGGTGGGPQALGSGDGIGDLLSVLPEQDATSKAVTSGFDNIANIAETANAFTPS
jgi:type IV secretion system protein TrbL